MAREVPSAGRCRIAERCSRPGRTPSIPAATVQTVVKKTTPTTPANATHWSTRTMAREVGISDASVRRIWHVHGLKPHLVKTFKVSRGPEFGLCQERHRHQEWLKFLRLIDQTIPQEKHIYLICENYATHKHDKVIRWLDRHRRFHVHFTPTSASCLNMVERFFRDLTRNQLRRGIFRNLEQLIMAIGNYIDQHNQNPKPFIWTVKASDILGKVTRAHASLDKRLSV